MDVFTLTTFGSQTQRLMGCAQAWARVCQAGWKIKGNGRTVASWNYWCRVSALTFFKKFWTRLLKNTWVGQTEYCPWTTGLQPQRLFIFPSSNPIIFVQGKFAPKGSFAISRDIFCCCHNLGCGGVWRVYYWHLLGRDQRSCYTSYNAPGGSWQRRTIWPPKSTVLRLRHCSTSCRTKRALLPPSPPSHLLPTSVPRTPTMVCYCWYNSCVNLVSLITVRVPLFSLSLS